MVDVCMWSVLDNEVLMTIGGCLVLLLLDYCRWAGDFLHRLFSLASTIL